MQDIRNLYLRHKKMTIDHFIKFYDEQGKQIIAPFKSGWGVPVGSKIHFGGKGYWTAIKRVERADGSLEIVVRKIKQPK
jgi:hypothetical protein